MLYAQHTLHCLPKSPFEVICGTLVLGMFKDGGSSAEFYKLTQQKVPGVIGNSCGLLHVMRDNNNGKLFFKLQYKLFDFGRCLRIKCRTGFIHKKDLRIYGE